MAELEPNDRTIWRIGGAAVALLALGLADRASAAERRGGIEIGAKGVKAVVVEVDSGQAGPFAQTLMTEVSNTTVAAGVTDGGTFAQQAIKDTAAAAGKFAQEMRTNFQIPPEKIRIIGSSGLPKAANRDELVRAIVATTGLAPMEFLTPCREVDLTIQGLVPPADRADALLVDVGSGNTKGGVIDSGGQVSCFSVPLGSVTFATRAAKDATDANPFPAAAEALAPTLLQAPLDEQIAVNPAFRSRSTVVLSGGAPYALATLMHPEAVGDPRVTISAGDIAAYAERLRGNPSVPKPDLAGVPEASRAAADQEVQNVLDNFTRENLIAGSVILRVLAEAFNFPDKKVVFDRTGVTAWIRADIVAVPKPDPEPTPDPTPSPTPTTTPRHTPTETNRPLNPADTPEQDRTLRPVFPSPQSPAPPGA